MYDKMLFIGVCGGALLAGRDFGVGVQAVVSDVGLDLFDGINIRYDANVGPDFCEMDNLLTSRNLMQVSTGWGIAIDFYNCEFDVESILVVNRKRPQWLPLVCETTQLLRTHVVDACRVWKTYSYDDASGNRKSWQFRLDGVFVWDDTACLCVDGVGSSFLKLWFDGNM